MTIGRFVVVEGIDGSGSTTIVERITAHLRAAGHDVHRTCEPSGGPVGAMIRQVLSHRLVIPEHAGGGSPNWATMALLFAADRLDHLQAEVTPHLERGAMVISDRYDLSSLAYQSATAPRGEPAQAEAVVNWIRELNRRAQRPDLTLVLDVTAEVAATRRVLRGSAKELYEGLELQARLAEAYLQADKLVPGDRLVHIDASLPIDDVLRLSLAAIDELR